MIVVKTDGGQTFMCDNLAELANTLKVPGEEVGNWETYEVNMLELARDLGRNRYESFRLDTDGSKKAGTKISGLAADFLGYKRDGQ